MSKASRVPKPAATRGASAIARSSHALANVFAALGDPTRLRLVAALCAGGALSIAQLTASTLMARQGVTKHLQVGGEAAVLRDMKLGRERLWQLEPGQIAEAKQTSGGRGRQ